MVAPDYTSRPAAVQRRPDARRCNRVNEERPGALPHGRQDKRPTERKGTPPPLVGGGWGEGLVGGSHRPTPPPTPLPHGEGGGAYARRPLQISWGRVGRRPVINSR